MSPRLTVSARLVLAVAVPTLALAVVGARTVADRHSEVRQADQVRAQVQVIDQLIALRTALFAERVAVEIQVPERRPPDDMLATTDFGQLVLDDAGPLAQATDDALRRVAPQDRPFEQAELDRARTGQEEWGRSPETIRARLEPLTSRTEAVMTSYATEVRDAAVELGDSDLIAAGTTFQRSIRLPDAAGEIVAVLSDLWGADPGDRLRLQSAVATELGQFASEVERLDESLIDADGPVPEYWDRWMEIPPSLQDLLDEVRAGGLSTVERQPSEPATVGLTLLEAIDWTLEAEALPLLAADEMVAVAIQVAEEARSAERVGLGLVLLAVAVSVAGAVLFGRSIVAPMRRLTGHAERIGGGELALDPLPLTGPPDVAAASRALNDAVGTLRLLERQSRALADIDLDHPSLREPLPGELGASLQRSTEVLATSIGDREQLRSRLQHDATHDSLTGLWNRAALIDALEGVGGPDDATGGAAALAIDVDGYKQIRNRLGHTPGDVVLQVTAGRIAELAPAGSTVARLDGDEFMVLLRGRAEVADAVRRAASIVEALGAPIEVGGHVLTVRACAGVATLDDAAAPLPGPSDLLQRADRAVQAARQAGPGSVVSYDAALARRTAEQDDVEQALVAALRPGASDLRLVFQPIVAASTGALVGVEALLRWNHAHGRWGPDQFVPIAERSALIVQLDLWVLHAAARQMAAWTTDPHLTDVPVAVNVSGRTLLQPSFVEEMGAALDAYGVAPSRLTLEVTETSLVTDLEFAADQLERIRSIGVRVAIDDFGTGYTSIAQLRALPIDELKIDGSFVRRLPDASDRILVQMINDVARLLHLSTVAEGVESAEQADVLRAIGCDALQGFHFSKPLDPAATTRWAAHRHVSDPAEQLR